MMKTLFRLFTSVELPLVRKKSFQHKTVTMSVTLEVEVTYG